MENFGEMSVRNYNCLFRFYQDIESIERMNEN
jgi:hypothetical protein